MMPVSMEASPPAVSSCRGRPPRKEAIRTNPRLRPRKPWAIKPRLREIELSEKSGDSFRSLSRFVENQQQVRGNSWLLKQTLVENNRGSNARNMCGTTLWLVPLRTFRPFARGLGLFRALKWVAF